MRVGVYTIYQGNGTYRYEQHSWRFNFTTSHSHPLGTHNHESIKKESRGEKFHLMRVRRTRDSPSNEVLRARTKPRFVRRQIFERPRNGKRKMRYLANTKRIHYPEKKCIRTKLDTCEKSFCCCQQPIRFWEIWRFEARIDVGSSRKLRRTFLP